jgi:hypothetical protein
VIIPAVLYLSLLRVAGPGDIHKSLIYKGFYVIHSCG